MDGGPRQDNTVFHVHEIGNETYLAAPQNSPHQSDGLGALYFVVAIVLIYGCSILMMIVSYICENKTDYKLNRYLKEMANVRKREQLTQLMNAAALARAHQLMLEAGGSQAPAPDKPSSSSQKPDIYINVEQELEEEDENVEEEEEDDEIEEDEEEDDDDDPVGYDEDENEDEEEDEEIDDNARSMHQTLNVSVLQERNISPQLYPVKELSHNTQSRRFLPNVKFESRSSRLKYTPCTEQQVLECGVSIYGESDIQVVSTV